MAVIIDCVTIGCTCYTTGCTTTSCTVYSHTTRMYFQSQTKVGIIHSLIVGSKHNYISGDGNDDNGAQANSKSDICPDVRFSYHMGSSALVLCKYSLYFTFKKN